MSKSTDLVQGTVDLMILKTLAVGAMHGWAVAARIRQASNDVLQVNQGALYPALHRLEHSGWIKSSWGESENKRRAKFYSLTHAGRKYLEREQATWERLSAAVGLVLKSVPG
jgi:PadR family transcriptional regulator PadR